MTSPAEAVEERRPPAYTVRPARPVDADGLPEIERRAARRFAEIGLAFLADGEPTPVDVFRRACRRGHLWVAAGNGGEVVGFAVVRALDDDLHLQEMDVVPEHGRRGLGRRLVESVCAGARERGARRVTLTTFRDVPWNAPFYRRLGFREIAPELFSPALRRMVAKELDAGLVPELRCVMERVVDPGSTQA
ncbi:MAG: GNAT family N-acetyltransferase [Acidobacteriota bacterium]